MSFSTDTLVAIGRLILIYGGLTMMALGMFGSLMVIIQFNEHPLNHNPCSTYIIVNGILSFLFLPLYFLPNIVTFGFQINWLAINGTFCKFQMSYGVFTIQAIFLLNCFILFDRYSITSRSLRIRSLSSIKLSRYLVFVGLFLSWFLVGMPAAVLFDNVPQGSPNGTEICTSRSNGLLLFAAFIYFPLIEGVLPIMLAIYFWYITRRHVILLNNQQIIERFDKQISRMCMYQISFSALASFPFATINLYRSLPIQLKRNQNEENIVQFFRLLAIFLFYIRYSMDFYIYALVSPDLRIRTMDILCFWHRFPIHWNNRVTNIQI